MSFIELEVSDIQNSPSQGEAFALLLKEKGSDRFVPIVIGISEARAVVFELNRIAPHRPGPHDIFQQLVILSGFHFLEVKIWKYEAGVFFANLILENSAGVEMIIDARTSDAVTLALKFSAPIFMDEVIFNKTAITSKHQKSPTPDVENEETEEVVAYEKFIENKLEEMTTTELQDLLTGAIKSEDYELASKIHDEMKRREEA